MLKSTTYPNELNIFLTNRCNLDCEYCYVKTDDVKNDTPLFLIKKAINFFLNIPNDKKYICFAGGEPLLSFDKIKEVSSYIDSFFLRKNIMKKYI